MKVFLLLIALSFHAQALKSLGREGFQGNVRPVLNGILSDFYQMIGLFPEYPKDIANLVETFNDIEELKANLKSHCPRQLSSKCLVPIDNIRIKLQQMEARTLLLVSHARPDSSLYMNALSGLRLISEFHDALSRFKGRMDNTSFLIRSNLPVKRTTDSVIKKLGELEVMISLAVVEFVPFTYKEDFRHFFFNFIHPVEIQIHKTKNYEFLNRNVSQLDFALNLLNMNLTKRNKKTPEGMAPYLATIHNKWNSILRYYR